MTRSVAFLLYLDAYPLGDVKVDAPDSPRHGNQVVLSDGNHLDVWVGGGEPSEIWLVTGQDHSPANLDRGRHGVSVGHILRARTRRSEDSTDISSERPVSVADPDPALPAEARIDHLAATGTAVQLSEDYRRDDCISLKAASRLEGGANLSKSSPVRLRQARQCL
jgi:hypothetical protein